MVQNVDWAQLHIVLASIDNIKVEKDHVLLACGFIYSSGFIDWLDMHDNPNQFTEETIGNAFYLKLYDFFGKIEILVKSII